VTVKRLGALVLSVAALLTSAVATPVFAASSQTNSVSITVTPDDFSGLRAGGTLRLTAVIANGGGSDLPAGQLTLDAGHTSLATRSLLSTWTGGSSTGVAAPTRVTRVSTPVVPTGGTSTVSLSVAASTLHLGKAGVYPLRVRLTSNGVEQASANTSVAWKVGSTASSKLSLVVPLVETAGTSGFIDPKTLAADTAPNGLLSTELDAVADTSITVGIDPRIIASIRVLGKTAPQSAIDWLARLETISNDTFPLAYADADETVQLQAGSSHPLSTKSFDFAINPANFRTATDPGSTSTPTPDPSQPALPSSADLVAWNYTMPGLEWPAENTVTAKNLAVLAAEPNARVLLSSSNVTRTAANAATASAQVGSAAVAVADTSLSLLVRAAVSASSDSEWNAAMQKLAAALAVEGVASGQNTPMLIATLGRSWPTTDSRLGATIQALGSVPWVSTGSLPTTLERAGGAAKLTNRSQDAQRVALVTDLLAAERREIRFSTIASNPAALTGARRLNLLALMSNAWQGDQAGWTVAAENFLAESSAIRGSVQVTRSSTINFLSDSGGLPVTVRNDLSQAVTVYVRVRPQTASLIVENSNVKLTIEANSQRRVFIPMQRLSNGRVEVTVSLNSGPNAFSLPVGKPVLVQVNVNAGWETAGTLIFGAVVLFVFAFGLVRNIRKRRKAARE
jgi:hypothetical protein